MADRLLGSAAAGFVLATVVALLAGGFDAAGVISALLWGTVGAVLGGVAGATAALWLPDLRTRRDEADA